MDQIHFFEIKYHTFDFIKLQFAYSGSDVLRKMSRQNNNRKIKKSAISENELYVSRNGLYYCSLIEFNFHHHVQG